jgi:hypothetical protein
MNSDRQKALIIKRSGLFRLNINNIVLHRGISPVFIGIERGGPDPEKNNRTGANCISGQNVAKNQRAEQEDG